MWSTVYALKRAIDAKALNVWTREIEGAYRAPACPHMAIWFRAEDAGQHQRGSRLGEIAVGVANCTGASSRLIHTVRMTNTGNDWIGRDADVRTGDNAAAGRRHDRGRVAGDGDAAWGSAAAAGDGTAGWGEPAAAGPRIRWGHETQPAERKNGHG